jgi:hypothetical protein
MSRMRWTVGAGALIATAVACGSGSKNGSGPVDGGGASDASDAGLHDGSSGGPEASPDGTSATTLSFPQLVQGVARVDTAAFPSIPLVVAASGPAPASVTVSVDGSNPVTATPTSDPTRFVATLSTTALSAGPHTLAANAPGSASAVGSLVVASSSVKFTTFAKEGPAYASHLVLAPSGDRLAFTWVSVASGTSHQLFLNYLDGAGARLLPADVVLNDPKDEPLQAYTAFSGDSIGVVYNVLQPAGSHWLVKLRVVDSSGAEKVPAMDLTQGDGAFSLAAAGADPGGFSGAWLHIQPQPTDGGPPPPVQVRFARWDTAAGKLVGPIVVDSDQPQPAGSSQGPLTLEPLAEMGIACNTSVCLVLYVRDVYNALVDLNVPKLFLGTVSLSSGQLAGTPQPIETSDWDTQEFGQQIVALADGSFVVAYTAIDTAAAVNPITPCDSSIERDLLYTVKVDATGKVQGKPAPVFDFQGSREYPRIAPHPDGWALFWEDQRAECNTTGQHIGMAMNVGAPDLASLLDPYLEAPGSIGLPPEYPSLAVTGTNFVAAWSDDRDGNGLAQPEPELFLETYWRQ